MRGNKAEFLSKLCQQHNWGYTRFDYRGHGESEAEPENCSLLDWLDDTLAVIDQTARPVVLIGSSMGAWLATHALLQRPRQVSALLTIAAAPDFPQTLLWPALDESQQQEILNGHCVSVPTAYEEEQWRIRKKLFDSGKQLALLTEDKPLDITAPVCMLHGTADADVPWTHSQQLLERFALSSQASLTLIQGGDHRLSEPKHLTMLKHKIEQLVSSLS